MGIILAQVALGLALFLILGTATLQTFTESQDEG